MFNKLKPIALIFGILLSLAVTAPSVVHAAPGQNAVVPAALASPMRQSFIPVVAEISQQIQNLVTGGEGQVEEPEETFGTRALGVILSSVDIVRKEGAAFATNFGAALQLEMWLIQQLTDPVYSSRWPAIAVQLLIVVGGAFIVSLLAELILLPARRSLARRRPETIPARLGALSSWLGIAVLPVILFIGAAVLLIDGSDSPRIVRLVVMEVVYAVALLRLVRLVARCVLAPRSPNLRIPPITTPQAFYIRRWVDAYSFIMVIGYFIVDLARLVKVPEGAVAAFSSIVGLVIVAMTITVIVQKRAFVSAQLRGNLSAAQRGLTLGQSLRLWLARSWHVLAIGYLTIGYIVTMLGAKGGFALMQRGTIVTLVILVALRMVSHLMAHMRPAPETPTSGIFRPIMRGLFKLFIWGAAITGIAAAWGVDVEAFLSSAWGQRIMGSALSIGSTIAIVVALYEGLHAWVERKLNSQDATGNTVVSGRSRTLLPMIRNAATVVMIVVVGMVTLSELGVNIAPLLAGAGVIGVAVGFGSQALVKDFLTGLFIILEDNIAIGDSVKIGEHSGDVEGMTIRTIRLRDRDGALHILPFGEITRIINQTKGFGYAFIDVGVAYDSDLDHVMRVMRETGDALEADPTVGDFMLEPIEVFGVDKLGDSSITITSRIKTKPGKHWAVRRAYLAKIKERFDAEGIEIPYPTIMHVRRDAGTA